MLKFSKKKKYIKIACRFCFPILCIVMVMLKVSACADNDINKVMPTNIIVFGDSLSDQGNLFGIISRIPPFLKLHMSAPPSSHNGHVFSNGMLPVEFIAQHYNLRIEPVWPVSTLTRELVSSNAKKVQIINFLENPAFRNIHRINELRPKGKNANAAEFLNEAVKVAQSRSLTSKNGNNYAVSNATISDDYPGLESAFFNNFSLGHQINKYIESSKGIGVDVQHSLFVILIGGNDIMQITTQSSSFAVKAKKISQVSSVLIKNIERLKAFGARKIVVIGPPNIGNIPAFYNSPQQECASKLSALLEQEIGTNIQEKFDRATVLWLPIQKTFEQEALRWPSELRHKACVSDIANGYYKLFDLILKKQLSVKYELGCSPSNMSKYLYYDYFHGTEEIYQLIAQTLIENIDNWLPLK